MLTRRYREARKSAPKCAPARIGFSALAVVNARRPAREPLIDRIERHPVFAWIKMEILFNDPRAAEPLRERIGEHPVVHTAWTLWLEARLRLLEELADIHPLYERSVVNPRRLLMIKLCDPPTSVLLESKDIAKTILKMRRLRV